MTGENDDDFPIWGIQNIATEIGQTLNQTYYLLKNGSLPARKIGKGKWVSTRGELRRALRGEVAQ